MYCSYDEVINKHYDVVVAGAGLAGISLSYELMNRGFKVLLLEAGERDIVRHSDNVGEGHVSGGLQIKPESRVVGMGGNTNTWGGLVATLDESDFERPWIAHGYWPLSQEELDGYYRRIAPEYRMPSVLDLEALHSTGKTSSFSLLNFSLKPFIARKPPANLKTMFDELMQNEVDICLGLTLEEVLISACGKHAEVLKLYDSDGNERLLPIHSQFVLALNAIENARILLNSPTFTEKHGKLPVGNYFMDHPKGGVGRVYPHDKYFDDSNLWGVKEGDMVGFCGYRLTDANQKRLRIGNHYVRFDPLYSWADNPLVNRLVLTFASSYWLQNMLFRSSRVPLRTYIESGEKTSPDETKISVRNFFGDLKTLGEYLVYRFRQKAPKLKGIKLRLVVDMVPTYENCVSLSKLKNKHGYSKADVKLALSPVDRDGITMFYRLLKKDIESSSFGDVDFDVEEEAVMLEFLTEASHHMGTTRMGDDPECSVVDKNQSVHGVSNMYVAGGSVFPVGGCANPGYTIIALSLRLADFFDKSITDRVSS